MSFKTLFAALLLASGLSGNTHAALLNGQTVNFQYLYPELTTPETLWSTNGNFFVDDSVEIANITMQSSSLDIRDSQLFIRFFYSANFELAAFNGFKLTVGAGVDDFTSVTIDALTTWDNFSADRIDFGSDYIFINWQGFAFNAGDVLVLNIGTDGEQVPEPTSLALLSLAMLAAYRLRQKV